MAACPKVIDITKPHKTGMYMLKTTTQVAWKVENNPFCHDAVSTKKGVGRMLVCEAHTPS